MKDRILRRPEVEHRTGKDKASIYRDIHEGTFPRPVKIGKRAAGWLESEIDHWIESRPYETEVAL